MALVSIGVPRGISRRAVLFVVVLIVIFLFVGQNRSLQDAEWEELVEKIPGYGRIPTEPLSQDDPNAPHPIRDLTYEAELKFAEILHDRSRTIQEAAHRYRERRGRHPPPGFDAWFAAAQKSKAIIIENFFDQIHDDINPMWAFEPLELRKRAHGQAYSIRVRNGQVENRAESREIPFRQQQWAKVVAEVAPHLPDIELPVNIMDETRIVVPWEEINKYMADEAKTRKMVPVDEATSEYGGIRDVDATGDSHKARWITDQSKKYWDHLKVGCPPWSPARQHSALPSFKVPIEYPTEPVGDYTWMGFVRNFTAAQDPCLQPHLKGMHGTFIESISMSTTHEWMPIFAETKMPQNNAILIPAAVYLQEKGDYKSGSYPGPRWSVKKNELVWRGVNSGGRNKKDNWWHMHRARFVQMLNGTTVSALEAGDDKQARTFSLPPDFYEAPGQAAGKLGEWVSTWANVGFRKTLCDTPEFIENRRGEKVEVPICKWFNRLFSEADHIEMKKQYEYKYLPDVDGNSFSGRWRAFLLSTSMPMKSTIYKEWHDKRLFAWIHFVPFDNSYMDIYSLIDFYMRHDAAAEKIAMDGKKWAETVLRHEDMMLYVWRLLLEYARVMDDNRATLAYVEDLL